MEYPALLITSESNTVKKITFTGTVVVGGPAAALCGLLSSGALVATGFTATDRDARIPAAALSFDFTEVTTPEGAADPSLLQSDLADHQVTNAELLEWGRSMMGGDTSNMLDI